MCLSKKSCSFLGGLIFGAAIGVVVALLYAPTKGQKMRKILRKRILELQKKAQEMKTEFLAEMKELKEKTKEEIGEFENKTKRAARAAVREFKKGE